MIDWPTTKTRVLVDDVATGRAFFGADGYCPRTTTALAPLTAYIPDDAPFVLTDPSAIRARRVGRARSRNTGRRSEAERTAVPTRDVLSRRG